jgi:hypothetical protein
MVDAPLHLGGVRAHAAVTAPGGVIDSDTIFEFVQSGDVVEAKYAGGKVVTGYLIGRQHGKQLEFRYCQTHTDGSLAGGHSHCSLRTNDQGKIEIVEEFEWATGGTGTNIIRQL